MPLNARHERAPNATCCEALHYTGGPCFIGGDHDEDGLETPDSLWRQMIVSYATAQCVAISRPHVQHTAHRERATRALSTSQVGI